MKNLHQRKSIGLFLSSMALIFTLTGCTNNPSTSNSKDDTPDEYGVLESDHGGRLQVKLHNKMLETHTTYVPYYRVNSYIGQGLTDVDATQSNNIYFYTGKKVSKSTVGTREHVWACANSNNMWTHNSSDGSHYVDGSGYRGGGSDLYHIRPCDGSINTFRGNGKFYEFSEGEKTYTHSDGGPYVLTTDREGDYATKVEPDDHFKGDIARILMYIYVHYNSIGLSNNYTGRLKLTDVWNSGYSETEIQKLMVKWNELDPVDETEKIRNDNVEKIQGNRNPFVDHPEYMARAFDIGIE